MRRKLTTPLVLALLLAAGVARAQIVTSADEDTSNAAPPPTVADEDLPPIPAPEILQAESEDDGTAEAASEREDDDRATHDLQRRNLRDFIAPSHNDRRPPENQLRTQRRGEVFSSRPQPFPVRFHAAAHDPARPTTKQLDLRFLIEWGGALAEWQGEISLDRGEISRAEHLGVAAMAPGGWRVAESSLRFEQAAPRAYDAISLSVQAVESASLKLRLTAGEVETTRSIPLRQLINQPHGIPLDGSNRLTIRRAPGDSLRVRLDTDSLIFEPGQSVRLTVLPNAADIDVTAACRCQLQLMKPRSAVQLWESTQDMSARPRALSCEIAPFTVPMPRDEGVYELIITLDPRGASTPVRSVGRQRTRRLQFVVLAQAGDRSKLLAKRDSSPAQDWRIVENIDPTTHKAVAANPPASASDNPTHRRKAIAARTAEAIQIGGRNFQTLPPGGWMAFPLETDSAGRPHRVEVEYPRAREQQLGLAIIEPTADGQAMRVSLDTGIDVAPLPNEASAEAIASAEAVFWPRSSKALVIVTNRSDNRLAIVGSIRVRAGPSTIGPAEPAVNPRERLVAARLDASDLTGLFGSELVQEETSGRILTDWQTFLTAAERLTQTLRDRGYNGAVIEVAGDGGALYPTDLLPALTRYDNGVLGASGHDLVRKDILELLFRVFDRQGLRLIPHVRFTTPLQELEQATAPGDDLPLLVDADRQSWPAAHPGSAAGPLYNPLNRGAQDAMQRVVQEMLERYGDHSSLAGISLDLDSDTYARLPGPNWGMDPATLKRFAASAAVGHDPIVTDDPLQWPASVRERWLKWRGAELASFYNRLHRELDAARPGLPIFLAGEDLLERLQPPAETSPDLLPKPVDISELLLEQGIAPEHFANSPGLVLLRPLNAGSLLVENYDAQASHATEINRAFRDSGQERQGGLILTRAKPLSLASPQAAKFLGVSDSKIRLRPHIGMVGARGGQSFTHLLASQDCRSVFVQGLMRLREMSGPAERVAGVLRRLPDEAFIPAGATQVLSQAQPLTIRRLADGTRTSLYVTNDSPWPVRATLRFQSTQPFEILELSSGEPIVGNQDPQWRLLVPPYDIATCTLSSPDVLVAEVSADRGEHLAYMLETEIDRLERHLSHMRRWDVLKGASFEAVDGGADLAGWKVSEGADLRVAVDSTYAADGKRSLLLQSRTPVGWSRGPVAWLRSHDLPTPASRRLALQVQARIDDPSRQPTVRLVVEGEVDGKRFQRQTEYGDGPETPALSEQWQKIGMMVDDLPEGEIRHLRVGVDLRGAGEVWVDDVRLFDIWLTHSEANQVSERLRLASISLAEGRFQDCRYALQEVGPQYLRHHFGHLVEAGITDNNAPASRSRQENLALEMARVPTTVTASRPTEQAPASGPREPQRPSTSETAPREAAPIELDANQELSPHVLTERRVEIAPLFGSRLPREENRRWLARPPATRPSPPAAETDREPAVETPRGPVATWLQKIFAPRQQPEPGVAVSVPRLISPPPSNLQPAPSTASASGEEPSETQRNHSRVR